MLHYTDVALGGLNEDALALDYWAGSAWEVAASGPYARYPGENWLSAPIDHLSRFAFVGKHTAYLPLVVRD